MNIDEELNQLLEDCTVQILQEVNYIKNIEDNYRNLDKWKPIPGQNILFVTGLSGSGKSTLTKELAKKYGAKIIELDAVEHHASAKDSDYRLERYMKKAMDIDKEYGKYAQDERVKTLNPNKLDKRDSKKFYKATKKVIKYIVNELYKSKQLFIVEGIQIIETYTYEELKNKPFVFKNTSMLTSLKQRAHRTAKRQGLEKPNADIFWKDVFMQAAWYIKSTRKFKKFEKGLEKE